MEVKDRSQLGQWKKDISDQSHAGDVRRAVVASAQTIGMDDTACGRVAIAVTEMATNIIKHATTGRMLWETLEHHGSRGLRIIAIDRGPGISDLTSALRDGYSTSGTAGNGLGAVRRLATRFDLYSLPDRGTCVYTEFWQAAKRPSADSFLLGVISQPIRGEIECGDGWGMKPAADTSFFMVVDGLGHGPFAADAAREAERVLNNSHANSAAAILQDCHDALRKTRGAAGAVAAVSQHKGSVTFAGIGNISCTVLDARSRRGIASHNGTLGHQMQKIQEFTVPWNPDSVLIMHSDGLGTKWDLNQYPGLTKKHPSVIAAILYRDFERERDDVTVLAAKNFE
jgi:anti-sigma regulatory factor (Ser/Thr protein kinase)